MTYILTDGLSGFSLEVLQPGLLSWDTLTSCTLGRQRERNPYLYSLPYFRIIPFVSLSILIGLVYAVVAPLLLPFLIVYFCLGYVVYINQVCFSKLVHIERSAFTFHIEDWKWTWLDLMFVFYECCLISSTKHDFADWRYVWNYIRNMRTILAIHSSLHSPCNHSHADYHDRSIWTQVKASCFHINHTTTVVHIDV